MGNAAAKTAVAFGLLAGTLAGAAPAAAQPPKLDHREARTAIRDAAKTRQMNVVAVDQCRRTSARRVSCWVTTRETWNCLYMERFVAQLGRIGRVRAVPAASGTTTGSEPCAGPPVTVTPAP